MDREEELPGGDAKGEFHGDQLLETEQVAAAQTGGAIRMGFIIEQIIARDNLDRPVLLPIRMPAPPTLQCAGPSELNAHMLLFWGRVD